VDEHLISLGFFIQPASQALHEALVLCRRDIHLAAASFVRMAFLLFALSDEILSILAFLNSLNRVVS